MSFLMGHAAAPPAPPPPPPSPPTAASATIQDAGAQARAAAAAASGQMGFDNTVGASGPEGAKMPSTSGGKQSLGDK